MGRVLPLAMLVAVALFGGRGLSQTVLHTYVESEAATKAGSGVAIWEDRNGDGYLDYVIGVPDGDGVGTNSGRVLVLSGQDNSVLATIQGPQAGGRFGQALANVKDLDGDGFDELAIGASGMGTVFVYSGATGALNWSTTHPTSPTFGWSVDGAGDVNGDTVLDVIAGSGSAIDPGVISAMSGNTGTIIYSRNHILSSGSGLSVAGVGDVNSDGFDDVAAGRLALLSTGAVQVFGGPTGTILHQLGPFGPGVTIGASVCGLDDLDGDGAPEFAVGDIGEMFIAGGPSHVYVYSGSTGSLMWTHNKWSNSEIGTSMANAGDVDHDGYNDLIVGDSYRGTVHVISPKRQVELFSHDGWPAIEFFGTSVAGGGDVDGDGFLDFLAGGAWTFLSSGALDPAGARLLTVGCWPDAAYNYCAAVANSTNHRAKMNWEGSTSIAANNFRLSADQCPPNKFGLFFYGPGATELPVGDGHLCVSGGLYRTAVVNTGPSGTPSHTLDFPNPPQVAAQISAGDTWFFSFWFRDPAGGPAGFNFADGLRATFCP